MNTVSSIDNKNTSKVARIGTLLESLRQKVHNFNIVDKQNQTLGKVKDLIIDANRQISFVVSTNLNDERQSSFLLSSKLVEKIDSQSKCIILKFDKAEIRLSNNSLDKNNKEKNMEEHTQQVTETGSDNITSVDEIIRLLGEKVIVDRNKRKVGEVIVRKQVETQIVQVPIRREKLIVEQVSPERKQLAEIDLSQGDILADFQSVDGDSSLPTESLNNHLMVSGEFSSPKIASLLLNAIALERNHGCKSVRVTILVEDEEHQQTYQEWFSRTSKG